MSTLPRRPPPPIPVVTGEEEEEEEEEEEDYTPPPSDPLIGRSYRFHDDNSSMEVKAFFEEHCCNFPLLVAVTHGQYGEIDLDTFCSGQVMLIHSYGSQSRVVTRDAKGRTFSIPRDYPLKFRVVKSRTKEGEEQSLADILDENSLPVQVRFSLPASATFYIGADEQQTKDIVNMVLADTYEETYMIANCLNTKELDETPILVPVYLKDATLSLVTGVHGMNDEEWLEYDAQIKEQMKNMKKVDIKIGNKDIAFLSEDCIGDVDSIYDYIEPRGLLKITSDDDDMYGVIVDDVYAAIYNIVDDSKVQEKKPELPERDKPKDKTPGKGKEDASKPTVPTRSKLVPEKGKSDSKHEYVNDIPRKEVAPLNFFKDKMTRKKSTHESKASWADRFEKGEVTVKDLKICELGHVMRELKLDKHVTSFKKQKIDGSIAQDLDKDTLQKELGFSSLEAIKFLKFISSGHIPK